MSDALTQVRLVRTRDGSTGLVVHTSAGDVVVAFEPHLKEFAATQSIGADELNRWLPAQPDGSWSRLIDQWESVEPVLLRFQEWAREQTGWPAFATVALGPPLPTPNARIFAIGANFSQHATDSRAAIGAADHQSPLAREKAAGLPPWGFTVFPDTVVGPDAVVSSPPGTTMHDYEAEVLAVLRVGSDGHAQTWGWAAWNDFSIRDPHFGRGPQIDRGPMTWSLQKNFDTGNACGPWLLVAPSEAVPDLAICTRVNGEERQHGSLVEMTWTYEDVVGHLSQYLGMKSGDCIASGTPAGTALETGEEGRYLQSGDVVEVEVTGLGTLRNVVA